MVGSGSGISKQNLLIAFIQKKRSDQGSGAFLPPGSGIRIRDGAMVGSGSGIKHPGSATLIYTVLSCRIIKRDYLTFEGIHSSVPGHLPVHL
jgi:hypothetical protein